jgi:LPXTG-motif cell wall-anchored protein
MRRTNLILALGTVMVAVFVALATPAIAQSSNPQVVADAKAKTATAGGPAGENADASCNNGIIDAQAGGVEAKAPCKPPPPPPPAPPPKAAAAPLPAPAPAPTLAPAPVPAPPPKAELPKSGGASAASLFSLGAGAILVGAGLMVRRIIK